MPPCRIAGAETQKFIFPWRLFPIYTHTELVIKTLHVHWFVAKDFAMYPLQNPYEYMRHFRWRPQSGLLLERRANKKFQRSQNDCTKHERLGWTKETSQMFIQPCKPYWLTGWQFEYSYSCSTPAHLENVTMFAVKTRSTVQRGSVTCSMPPSEFSQWTRTWKSLSQLPAL